MKMYRLAIIALSIAAASALLPVSVHAKEASSELGSIVPLYQAIAESIVAARNSETAVVRAILERERELALAALDRSDLRAAAARMGDFATEGGAAVEPIRNRLTQAGHHHNSNDTGPQAVYDEGYVVITKKAKTELLDLAKRCAKAGEAAKPDGKEVAALRAGFIAAADKAIAAAK